MSSNDRLRGRALQRARANMRAESPLCVHCEARGVIRPWTQLDHKIPIEKGGTDDWSNLQGLCDDCHDRKTRADRGYRAPSGCDASGLPTDPDHPWAAG